MPTFLKQICLALEHYYNSEVVAFYTDFSKVFDKLLHFERIKKVAETGIGGGLLEVRINFLGNRRQLFRVDNVGSDVLEVTNVVLPPGLLAGTPCYFVFLSSLLTHLLYHSHMWTFFQIRLQLAFVPRFRSKRRECSKLKPTAFHAAVACSTDCDIAAWESVFYLKL